MPTYTKVEKKMVNYISAGDADRNRYSLLDGHLIDGDTFLYRAPGFGLKVTHLTHALHSFTFPFIS